MRVLKFIVNGQSLKQDPNCDFSGLSPGTAGYLQAEFAFSSEWDGCDKVVGFYSNLGREFTPQVLTNGTSCMIPAEALKKSIFKVRVIGQKRGCFLATNRLPVHQRGGNT